MPMLMTLRIGLPVWPFHSPLRTRSREVGHLVEHGMHLGHDVLAIHDDRLPLGGAQGHVQDGALLGDVDLLAPEHGVDTGSQAGFLGQLQEEPQRLVGDAVLGVVEVDADGLGGEALAAVGVVREELPEVQLLDLRVMGFERLPRRALSEWCDGCCHVRSASDVCLSSTAARSLGIQPAFLSASLLDAMHASSSFQDLTNDLAPSSWSWAARASVSMPALANLANTSSQ